MKCPSRALLLQDLCRLQLQNTLLWRTFYNDFLAANALLLTTLTSLARASLGRKKVRVEHSSFEKVFDGHFL